MKFSTKSYKRINDFITELLNNYHNRYWNDIKENVVYFDNYINTLKEKIFLWADIKRFSEEYFVNHLSIWHDFLHIRPQEEQDLVYEYNFYISLLIYLMSPCYLNALYKSEILMNLEVCKNIYSDYIFSWEETNKDELGKLNINIQEQFKDEFDLTTYEGSIDEDNNHLFLIDTFCLELANNIYQFYNHIKSYYSIQEELIDGENLMLENNSLYHSIDHNNEEVIEEIFFEVFNNYHSAIKNSWNNKMIYKWKSYVKIYENFN